MTRLVDESQRYGIPVLAVTAVGRDLTRDARYLRLATRICAELGAHVVKTYHCADGFDTVTAACPVPLVMAGGSKLPELQARSCTTHSSRGKPSTTTCVRGSEHEVRHQPVPVGRRHARRAAARAGAAEADRL